MTGGENNIKIIFLRLFLLPFKKEKEIGRRCCKDKDRERKEERERKLRVLRST